MKFIYTITAKDGRTAVIDSGEIPHFEAEFEFKPTGDPEICADIKRVWPEVREQRVNSSNELGLPLDIAMEKMGYTFSRKIVGPVVYPPGDIIF